MLLSLIIVVVVVVIAAVIVPAIFIVVVNTINVAVANVPTFVAVPAAVATIAITAVDAGVSVVIFCRRCYCRCRCPFSKEKNLTIAELFLHHFAMFIRLSLF